MCQNTQGGKCLQREAERLCPYSFPVGSCALVPVTFEFKACVLLSSMGSTSLGAENMAVNKISMASAFI